MDTDKQQGTLGRFFGNVLTVLTLLGIIGGAIFIYGQNDATIKQLRDDVDRHVKNVERIDSKIAKIDTKLELLEKQFVQQRDFTNERFRDVRGRIDWNQNTIVGKEAELKEIQHKAVSAIQTELHKAIADLRKIGFDHLLVRNNPDFHMGFLFFGRQNEQGNIIIKHRHRFEFLNPPQVEKLPSRIPRSGDVLRVKKKDKIRQLPVVNVNNKVGIVTKDDWVYVLETCAGPYSTNLPPTRTIWIKVQRPKLDVINAEITNPSSNKPLNTDPLSPCAPSASG